MVAAGAILVTNESFRETKRVKINETPFCRDIPCDDHLHVFHARNDAKVIHPARFSELSVYERFKLEVLSARPAASFDPAGWLCSYQCCQGDRLILFLIFIAHSLQSMYRSDRLTTYRQHLVLVSESVSVAKVTAILSLVFIAHFNRRINNIDYLLMPLFRVLLGLFATSRHPGGITAFSLQSRAWERMMETRTLGIERAR